MSESQGTPLPPPAGTQKTNPWVIIIAVIVLACCLCMGLIGLLIAFGDPILHELGLNALMVLVLPL